MVTERMALAYLCAWLPELRRWADRGSWSDDLQWRVEEVAAGASAVAACRELGLLETLSPRRPADPAGPQRFGTDPPGESGSAAGARLPGLDEVVLSGRYGCPLARCARRGQRDDEGRPPRCDLVDAQMTFSTDPAGG